MGLIDFGDVVAHVFRHDTRSHYALEHLWERRPIYPGSRQCVAFDCHTEETMIQKTTSRKMV